ncbi:VOC family protein [Streptomyces pinistramenti]|uniref:VOC family protein n=1 Tax=Streptomyces pinistramenti TaxID=2884812 RepID=UPI001D09731D|nr:VOC family protein [Streptomyces pinistramenti]MCB5909688.1 VOC family protein [Streptomyces pinistramenti]
MSVKRKLANLVLGNGQGVPCLRVGELDRAVRFYRDQLGFAQVSLLGGAQPHAALCTAARRGGAVLLSQTEEGSGEPVRRRPDQSYWDAVFFVDDIDRVAGQLRARGVRIDVGIGISAVSSRMLEICDDWGNRVAFAEAGEGWRPALRRLTEQVVPPRVRTVVRDVRFAREERAEYARFERFYGNLPSRLNPVYMFFTSGLLHWVLASEKHIPAEVNLVLFGSGLTDEEQRWLSENLDRPVYNSALEIDDNTAWEFLFEANRTNFGYIDIDCFVLEPKVFSDLSSFDDGVAVNAVWTYRAAPGVPIGCTHLMFLNAAVIAELRTRGRYLSPTNYDWRGSKVPLLHHRTYCRIPTASQRRLLLEVLPADEAGLPVPPAEAPFFDTLVGYQIAAAATGYRTHAVRPLAHRTQTLFAEARSAGKQVWQQDWSDELVHIGGISYYGRYFHATEFRKLYLAAEYSVLCDSVDKLPVSYQERKTTIERQQRMIGLDPATAREFIHRHLASGRGLGPNAVERVIGTAKRVV